jgi:hypothetical protein
MASTQSSFSPEADVVVEVSRGILNRPEVVVHQFGTIQFVNRDPVDYKLRLWVRDRPEHPDVDLLLSGRCGVTLIVDDAVPETGQCYYELFPIEVTYWGWLADAQAAQRAEEIRRGGGEVKIGPSPDSSGATANSVKGPGGGPITGKIIIIKIPCPKG